MVVVIDLSPNKLLETVVDCAEFDMDAPKIEAPVFGVDETLVASAPNEVDPNRPLLATD